MDELRTLDWKPRFYQSSPVFLPLYTVARAFADMPGWPTLADFQAVFESRSMPVKPVAQAGKPVCFEELYESRIYLQGELQTRLQNWHDFFNALVWLRFPQTKSVLNELHYVTSMQRRENTNRSPLENAITLFDECGAVVISERDDLLQLIREHRWKELFVHHRDAFEQHIKCIVFGHAMYEKALNPYVGMTTNTLLVHSAELLDCDTDRVDQYLADCWKQGVIDSTADLKPFPILGVPGWYEDNENTTFYDNRDYFRPKRRQSR